MSLPSSPVRHNYAAPHTPIASSKRPRPAPSKEFASPTRIVYEEKDDKDYDDAKGTNNDMHIASPSKNLFSPYLKYDNDDDVYREHSPSKHSDGRDSPKHEVSETTENDENAAAAAVEEEEEDEEEAFNPYLFIAFLPSHESVREPGKICLPKQSDPSKITLALDLDETLVHCTIDAIPNPDIIFPVTFNSVQYQVYVKKRPYLDRFLEAVSKNFEVVLFTASQQVYADTLLNIIDRERRFIQHRLFRDACLNVHGNYLKDLTVLGRNLNKTVLVDNSPHAYGYQIDNGVPIESWFDDPRDTELLKLLSFLEKIHGSEDVRPVIHNHFKTYKLVNDARNGLPVSLSAPPF